LIINFVCTNLLGAVKVYYFLLVLHAVIKTGFMVRKTRQTVSIEMKKYFIHNGVEHFGPFDTEDLKQHKIQRETPIWYEGLEDWTTAEKIVELKPLFAAIPPPFRKVELTPPKIEKKEKVASAKPKETDNNSVKALMKKNEFIVVFILSSFMFFSVVCGILLYLLMK
jgi:hypothetical protein